MTEAMPFLQKCDITFLRPPPFAGGIFIALCFVTEQKSKISTCPSNELAAGLTGRHCLPALPGVTHWPWPLAT